MFEQERVIGRLQRRVAADPAVLACFLSGSFGRNAADSYSDLDAALVFADEAARGRAWEERHEFAQSVMPYVAIKSVDAGHVQPYFYIVLFANGSKVDYRYESAASLSANPWDSQIRILKDSGGWAEAYQAACARLSKPQPAITSSELAHLDQRFWVMYWDALRLLARGEYDKPFTIYLELLSLTIPALMRALPAPDPARDGLIQAYYGRDPRSTLPHLAALMQAYLAARSALVQHYHLQPIGDQAFESEIRKIIDKLT
jgi:hypothetical protein